MEEGNGQVINNELFTPLPANLSTDVVSRRMRIRTTTTTTTTTTTESPTVEVKSQEAVSERKSVDPNEVFMTCCKKHVRLAKMLQRLVQAKRRRCTKNVSHDATSTPSIRRS